MFKELVDSFPELIKRVIELIEYFNAGHYLFFILFIVSFLFVSIKDKNKKNKLLFGYFPLIMLFVVINPVTIFFLGKIINSGSMYRIFFMLPLIPTIAYGLTLFGSFFKKKVIKLVYVIAMCFVIIFCGEIIINSYTVFHVDNWYKLPEEDVEVALAISKDKQTSYKRAMVPYGMSSRIRQIDPKIKLAYSRIISQQFDENGNALLYDTDDASNFEPVQKLNAGDVEYISKYCIANQINYVVFSDSTPLSKPMEQYGFERMYETENYVIYRLIESKLKQYKDVE